MKSRKLTIFTAIAVFAALAISLRLTAQERPGGQSQNPVPLINQPLVPDAVAPGGKGFTLTVNGTGFVSGSVVNWNGSALATTFVNGAQLTATVPASDISKANTASVTVASPGPGGGTSNLVFFPIFAPNAWFSVASSGFSTGSNPFSAMTADLNGDGKLDLVVSECSNNDISVRLGNGDGTFQDPVTYSVVSCPFDVAAGDFNGDGKLDLAVANYNSNTVSVLLGNGDGTFGVAKLYDAGNEARAVAVGDFNGDGKLDLAVANQNCTGGGPPCGQGTVSILLGNGDGTFQNHMDYDTANGPTWVTTGDFNGDGNLDLAVSASNGGSGTDVSVLLGDGRGVFHQLSDITVGVNPVEVATADFNKDGKLDLAVVNNAGLGNGSVSILLGNGDGTFQNPVDYSTGSFYDNGLAVADFNQDGNLDLAVTNGGSNTVSVFLGKGDGTFPSSLTSDSGGSDPFGVLVGDFDRDGRLDLVVTNNYGGGTVAILLQNGTITISPSSLNFGVQLVGDKSAAQKVVLTNIGSKTLDISGITIAGMAKQDFSERDNCGSSLPPGKHCTISVNFKPTKLGPRRAAIKITDNAPGSPQQVPLRGIGVTSGPNATLSTRHLTFTTQLVGTMSPDQPVKLSNYGTETLDITSIVASGDFSEKHDCGSSLPPGGSCTIEVSFAPARGGHRTGTLTITDNAPDSPQKVSLTGAGTVVKLDPASLDFGTVTIGQKSSPQDTTLTNVGETRLHITGIAITGTDSGDFSIEQTTCPNPGYLGAEKSCTITVIFQPSQSGSRSADVSITDNGGGSPQQVSLSGTGEPRCPQTCGFGCIISHCKCSNGRCVPASNAVVEESASRQTCKTNGNNPFTELR